MGSTQQGFSAAAGAPSRGHNATACCVLLCRVEKLHWPLILLIATVLLLLSQLVIPR